MEQPPYSKAEKRRVQDLWLNARMQGNSRWSRTGDQRTVTAADRKVFVIWGPAGDQPRVIDTLRIEDIEASFTGGITVFMSSHRSTARVRISSLPREIFPGVWMWIPPFAEVRFCPFVADDSKSVWRLTLPMSVRTAPGHDVRFSTVKEFRDLWPDVSL